MQETLLPKIYSSTAITPHSSNLKFGQNKSEQKDAAVTNISLDMPKDVVEFEQKKLAEPTPKEEKEDTLMKYPLRLCAYTNEVGAAFAPVPGIGSTLFALSWVPALMYFGADIYNKFVKGENGDYSKPSGDQALKATVFQGLASVILPTAAVVMGQKIANKLSGLTSENALKVSQKEDILNELKRDLNQDKLRNYRDKINTILKEKTGLTMREVKQSEEVKQIKQELGDLVYKNIQVENQVFKHHKQTRGPLKALAEIIFHTEHKCQNLASIKDNKFEDIVRPYLQKNLDNMVDTRIELQNAMNPNGSLNEKAKLLDSSLHRKLKKILQRNMQNSDITDKSCYAVKEVVISQLQKTAMKLSTVKIAGGLAALAVMAGPIDKFVEYKVVPKVGKKQN